MCELFAMSSSEPANVTFSLGVFGEHLFAHRSTRLFVLERSCPASNEALGSDSLQASLTTSGAATQRVALVATQPLTLDEAWTELPAGVVVVLRNGRRQAC